MAKMKSYYLDFDAPTGENSDDIVGFRVYVVRTGEPFSYDLPSAEVSLGGEETHNIDEETHSIDLAGLVNADGTYDAYVTSVDEAGNESDPAVLEGVVIDFTAPAKPVNLRMR